MIITTEAPPSTPRERILNTAFRLFYAHGLRAVGVDTIIAEAGVAKATFYRHFPGKDDLIVAYLDTVDQVWSGQLHAAAEAAGPAPADQLVGLFDALGTACRREGYRGCAFINAAAEAAPGSAVHDRTVAHKHTVLAWIGDLARSAGARHPELLARSLTLLLDGGLASGALDADPEAAEAARATAGRLVQEELAGREPDGLGSSLATAMTADTLIARDQNPRTRAT
jgi:AcrR family transcriptional regulator